MKKLFLIFLFSIFKISNVMAVLDHDQIIIKAGQFLNSKNQNLVLKINNKIKIPSCYGEIEIKNKYDNFKTLEIICLGELPWKYNLRTNISKNFDKKKKKNKIKKKRIGVFVSMKRLKRGHILDSEDLKL